MFILDNLLVGSLQFVLDKVLAAAEAESQDDSALREQLLDAQMRLELGEITETEFVEIERDVLAASRPAASYGQALSALDAGYAREGAAGGWAGHYQGGPIGFAQREFEIAPCQHDSPWYSARIEAGHAVAWNPSLPGGAKAEDTYLVSADGVERLTTGQADPAWPVEDGDDVVPPRPAVLEV